MKKSDLLILKSVIAGASYTGLENNEIGVMLESLGTTDHICPIPSGTFQGWLAKKGIYLVLEENRQTSPLARVFLGLLSSPHISNIDFSEPETMALLDGAVASLFMTAIQKTELMSILTRKLTLAEEILGQGVKITHLDIAEARRI